MPTSADILPKRVYKPETGPQYEASQDLKHLQEQHREILRRLVAGQRPKAIARVLGIDKNTVYRIKGSTLGRNYLERLHDKAEDNLSDMQNRFSDHAPLALAVIEEIVADEDNDISPSVRLNAAKDLLDRAGHAPIKQVEEKIQHHMFNQDDIESMKKRAHMIDIKQETEAEEVDNG